MSLTRREFLSVLGIAAAVPFVDPLSRLVLPRATSDEPALLARLFDSIDSHLADSVHPILEVSDTRYRLPFGWIEKTQAYPIPAAEYRPPTSIMPNPGIQIGGWVSAAAPTVILYERPNMQQPSHAHAWGYPIFVVDVIPPAQANEVVWLGVVTDTWESPYWTQAHFWEATTISVPHQDHQRHAILDRNTYTLTAYEQTVEAFSVVSCITSGLRPGRYHISDRNPTAQAAAYFLGLNAVDRRQRASIKGLVTRGFGSTVPFSESEAEITLPIYAARALYQFLPDGAEIHVI